KLWIMDFVPVAFVDALCATLDKEDLKDLQEIGRPWSRTAKTHYSRRREFEVSIDTNHDGTEVGVKICDYSDSDVVVRYSSLSKYDRIGRIFISTYFYNHKYADLPEKMSMERFRKKVLPVLISLTADYYLCSNASGRNTENLTDTIFSSLHAPPFSIKTRYAGGKCVEFIEEQVALGRLEHLELHGTEWPDSMEASLKSFLRSPNFISLDLRGANLRVDLEMLDCIVQRFLKGDFRKGMRLEGEPADGEVQEMSRILRSGDTPSLGRLPEPFTIFYFLCTDNGVRSRRLRGLSVRNTEERGSGNSPEDTSTVATHYIRRREFEVSLHVNPEETEVGIGVFQYGRLTYENVSSLSKYVRIRWIWVGSSNYAVLPDKMPLERFKTKVLPVLNSLADAYDLDISSRRFQNLSDTLFSSLRGRALKIKTRYREGKCVEFIERQIKIGHLNELELLGQKWPESIKSTLKSFLKSPNFMKLDLRATNLRVDSDMLRCIVKCFLKGVFRKGTRLLGKPSDEMKALHRALLSGDTLPWLGRFLQKRATILKQSNSDFVGIYWTRPGSESLHAWISSSQPVTVYRLYDGVQSFDV
uniref:F-box domain-containing protein n=1 Tax=Steinernema glaseri TaxID=37863 RepID=A0A1I8AAR2_9BILA